MKICTLCKEEKELKDFNLSRKRKDGLQTRCRECSRATSKTHFQENPEYYRSRNHDRRRALRDMVNLYKQGKPCQDCEQEFPPYVMDFDHREGQTKVGSVSTLILRGLRSLQSVLLEMAKCDLVCANCHRIRTHQRALALGSKCTTRSSKKYA